jgi:hypothetical protein
MNRALTRLKRQVSTGLLDFKNSVQRTVSSLGRSVRRASSESAGELVSLPRQIARGTASAGRATKQAFLAPFRWLRQAPDSLRDQQKSAVQAVRASTARTVRSAKQASVLIKEQPGDLSRGAEGFRRRLWRGFRGRPAWVQGIVVVVAVGFLAAPFAAKPAWRASLSWRSDRLAQGALSKLAEGDSEGALNRARAAHFLDRDNPAPIRAMARAAYAIDPAQSLAAARLAAALVPAQLDDLLRAGEAALKAGQNTLGETYAQQARSVAPGDGDVASLEARLRYARGTLSLPEAHALAESRMSDEPLRESYFALALSAGSAEDQDKALALARRAAEAVNSVAAWRFVMEHPTVASEERIRAARRLSQATGANLASRIASLDTLHSLGALAGEQLLAQAAELVRFEDDPEMVQLAIWMARRQLHAEAIQLLESGRAFDERNLLQVYIGALIATGRGTEALEILGSTRQLPLTQIERLVLQAGAQRAMGTSDNYEALAGLAIARSEIRDFSFLERTILSFRNENLLIEFYRRVARDPRTAALGRGSLLAYGYALYRPEVVAEALPLIDARREENPSVLNLILYLKFLNREADVSLVQMSEGLVARYPEVTEFRLSLAMAYLQLGRRDQAAELIASNVLERLPASDGQKASLAATLWQLGRTEEAQRLIEMTNRNRILPAETSFWEQATSIPVQSAGISREL